MALSKVQKTIFEDSAGTAPASGATCTIFKAGSLILATLYTTRSGVATKLNPVVTGADGLLEFYVDPDRYDISVTHPSGGQSYDDFLVVSETVVKGPTPTAEFATLAKAIIGETTSGTVVDWADYNGKEVRTVVNNSTSKAGGANYIVKTLAQAAIDGDVIDGNGVIGVNHAVDATYCIVMSRSVRAVPIESCGGIGGGAADNLALLAALPAGTLVRLKGNTTYFVSSVRPDLSHLEFIGGEGATLKMDANPNVKELGLFSDITIENTVHLTSLVKHENTERSYLFAASNSSYGAAYSQPEQIPMNGPLVTAEEISGINTRGAFTGTIVSDQLMNWAAGFGANQQGAFVAFEEDVYFEAAFRQETAVTVAGFRGISIPTVSQRIDFAVDLGVAQYRIIDAIGGVLETGVTPNGGAYAFTSFGAITIAVRVTSSLMAEFYINGTKITEHQLLSTPYDIGFTSTSGDSIGAQIWSITKQKNKKPKYSRQTSVAIVGDSISYGAWASEAYEQILKNAFTFANVGDLTSTVNYAVSGSSTPQWITGGAIDIDTKDLTSSEYTLIMLGTNDLQADFSEIDFETNLRSIVASVISQGSKPVLGVFPVFTTAAVSGVTGVTTTNYFKGGLYRQMIKWVAADLNIPLADVCEEFGVNYSLYGDNIHPTEKGLIGVASAFARAVEYDRSSKADVNENVSLDLTLLNSWAAIVAKQVPRAKLSNRVVTLNGPITGGAVATVIATLPLKYRPLFERNVIVPCNDGGAVEGFAKLKIEINGDITIESASVTPFIVWLDGFSYNLS